MILLLDENLPMKVARALAELGIDARHVRDHFPERTPDIEIFAFIAKVENCFLLTRDDKIRRHPHEIAALRAAGIGVFILTGRAQKSVIETMSFVCDCLPENGGVGNSHCEAVCPAGSAIEKSLSD